MNTQPHTPDKTPPTHVPTQRKQPSHPHHPRAARHDRKRSHPSHKEHPTAKRSQPTAPTKKSAPLVDVSEPMPEWFTPLALAVAGPLQ